MNRLFESYVPIITRLSVFFPIFWLSIHISCVNSEVLKANLDNLSDLVSRANREGAKDCAPIEFAKAQANLIFAENEVSQGNPRRAMEHIAIGLHYMGIVNEKQRECKRVVITKKEVPIIVSTDSDGDGIADNIDRCPNEPEDLDGDSDEDGCPDIAKDSDVDGIVDELDKCPFNPEDFDNFEDADGCPDTDNDMDGILDDRDKCPMEPETVNDYLDDDGCPDEIGDRDGDSIQDNEDACPDTAEDKDGYKDMDGCPDPDNDEDGIPDLIDKCPMEAEDIDGDADDDGCPDVTQDRDNDGIADNIDKCPELPETKNDYDDEDGCPDEAPKLVIITKKEIKIKEKIHFDVNKSTIKPISYPVLDDVVKVLKDHPDIRIRIEGHTDSQGPDEYNLKLSEARSHSVLLYLVEHGIDRSRLTAVGYGESRPIDTNETQEGRSMNRRVEFHIITEGEE